MAAKSAGSANLKIRNGDWGKSIREPEQVGGFSDTEHRRNRGGKEGGERRIFSTRECAQSKWVG